MVNFQKLQILKWIWSSVLMLCLSTSIHSRATSHYTWQFSSILVLCVRSLWWHTEKNGLISGIARKRTQFSQFLLDLLRLFLIAHFLPLEPVHKSIFARSFIRMLRRWARTRASWVAVYSFQFVFHAQSNEIEYENVRWREFECTHKPTRIHNLFMRVLCVRY